MHLSLAVRARLGRCLPLRAGRTRESPPHVGGGRLLCGGARCRSVLSHAAGDAQRGGDGCEERDGYLQDCFPGLAFHRFCLV